MFKFVGANGTDSEESAAVFRGDTRAEPIAAAPYSIRDPVRAALGFIRPLGRTGSWRRNGKELVSVRWTPQQELQLELDRGRRYGHQFGLVRISYPRRVADHSSSIQEFARALAVFLRRVDRVWIDRGGVYVLLPECDRTKVEAMLDRIHERLDALLGEGGTALVSSAVFPDDGLTSGALTATLEKGNGQALRRQVRRPDTAA